MSAGEHKDVPSCFGPWKPADKKKVRIQLPSQFVTQWGPREEIFPLSTPYKLPGLGHLFAAVHHRNNIDCRSRKILAENVGKTIFRYTGRVLRGTIPITLH